jgi:hypothetical protein
LDVAVLPENPVTPSMILRIMGEHVGRLRLNVNRKPEYNVRQAMSGDYENRKGVLRV